mgnify:CR=1 FL=1
MNQNDTSRQPLATNSSYAATSGTGDHDEIDLLDLMKNIWSQRGLVIGIMLIAVLAVLSFHFSKATFSVASRIDYPISLSFIGSNDLVYPNGTVFSPRDLVTNGVLLAAIKQTDPELRLKDLQEAVHVHQSNSLLAQGEAELTRLLTNAKTPEDIKAAAEKSLKELRDIGLAYVTLTLDLTKVGVSEQQGALLLTNVVDAWAKQSINRGLMDVTITRPMVAFTAINGGNVIDNYDRASSYLDSLQVAATQLSELSGLNSLVVNGMTIEDIQRRLNALGTRDINPLRGFAYTNSDILSKSDAAIQVRLFSRQRLLNLEKERLTKLIESYDLALEQLGSSNPQQQVGATASRGQQSQGSQGNAAQFDQSFLDSLLKLGTRLGAVDARKELFERRMEAVSDLLVLEKEIAILRGTSSDKGFSIDPDTVLQGALVQIAKDLNEIQQDITRFVDATRELTIANHTQVYSASSAPQVRGGLMQLAPRFVLMLVLGAVLGLFLGLFIALIRSALLKSK